MTTPQCQTLPFAPAALNSMILSFVFMFSNLSLWQCYYKQTWFWKLWYDFKTVCWRVVLDPIHENDEVLSVDSEGDIRDVLWNDFYIDGFSLVWYYYLYEPDKMLFILKFDQFLQLWRVWMWWLYVVPDLEGSMDRVSGWPLLPRAHLNFTTDIK